MNNLMNSMEALLYFSQLINQSTSAGEQISPVSLVVDRLTEVKPILTETIDLKSIQYSESNIFYQYLKGELHSNSFITSMFNKIYFVTVYFDAVSLLSQESSDWYQEYMNIFSMSNFPNGFFFGFSLKREFDVSDLSGVLTKLELNKEYLDSFYLWRSNYYKEAFLVSAYNFITNAGLESTLKSYISNNYCYEDFSQGLQFIDDSDNSGNSQLIVQQVGLNVYTDEYKLEQIDNCIQDSYFKMKVRSIDDLYQEYLKASQ